MACSVSNADHLPGDHGPILPLRAEWPHECARAGRANDPKSACGPDRGGRHCRLCRPSDHDHSISPYGDPERDAIADRAPDAEPDLDRRATLPETLAEPDRPGILR
jgi:hypothetical protein